MWEQQQIPMDRRRLLLSTNYPSLSLVHSPSAAAAGSNESDLLRFMESIPSNQADNIN